MIDEWFVDRNFHEKYFCKQSKHLFYIWKTFPILAMAYLLIIHLEPRANSYKDAFPGNRGLHAIIYLWSAKKNVT
jgi:hypothetical protein